MKLIVDCFTLFNVKTETTPMNNVVVVLCLYEYSLRVDNKNG